MACYHPWYRPGQDGERAFLPCGRCVGCLKERARQWAVRCMHEASLYDRNAMVTLTYEEEWLPPHGFLDREAFPLFMKRLRKAIAPQRVRSFYCGEYGRRGRPHYHGLLFGWDAPDKKQWTERRGSPVWHSSMVERLWPFGISELGSVTFASAQYVAQYVLKKRERLAREGRGEVVDLETGEVHEVVPEFVGMSRRPGIGRGWIDRYHGEVYREDAVVVNAKRCKPPRYYDQVLALIEPAFAAAVCFERARRQGELLSKEGPSRRSREAVAKANVSERSLE